MLLFDSTVADATVLAGFVLPFLRLPAIVIAGNWVVLVRDVITGDDGSAAVIVATAETNSDAPELLPEAVTSIPSLVDACTAPPSSPAMLPPELFGVPTVVGITLMKLRCAAKRVAILGGYRAFRYLIYVGH